MFCQWMMYKRKDYLYYMLYVFTCGLFIAFRVNNTFQIFPFNLSPLLNELTDQPLICFAIWMYVRFSYHFLNLKQLQPKVYKPAKRVEYGFAGFIIIKLFLLPMNLGYRLSAIIYLIVSLILISLAVFLIIALLRQKNLLNNFLVSGSLCISIGGALGQVFAIFLPNLGENNLSIYYALEIAILIEFFLLATGFAMKNKILQQQVIKAQQEIIKSYEKRSVHN